MTHLINATDRVIAYLAHDCRDWVAQTSQELFDNAWSRVGQAQATIDCGTVRLTDAGILKLAQREASAQLAVTLKADIDNEHPVEGTEIFGLDLSPVDWDHVATTIIRGENEHETHLSRHHARGLRHSDR